MTPAKNPILAADVPINSTELMALPQRQKVVLVMDLVESVRLMAANELAVVDHWRGFVRHATAKVLPQHHGRMVKSLGDGIMVEFESPRNATNAAVQLHRYFDSANATLPPDQQLYLRAGLNTAQVYIDDIDIYGSGVNLAARVASLAGPGETMVTAEVRDGLTDGLDAKVQDMGECYLKHVAQPVRAFRVGDAGPSPILPSEQNILSQSKTIAVIPLSARSFEREHFAIGELIADGVISQLGRTAELTVVSRLATTALRDRAVSVEQVGAQVNADYVLNGSYVASSAALLVSVELVDTHTQRVLWTDRISGEIADLLEPASEICNAIAQGCHEAILNRAVEQAIYKPLPTLAGQSLMFAGVAGVHQAAREGFAFSGKALTAVVERHPRHSDAYAWLAKWHAIGANRGLQNADSLKVAVDLSEKALQIRPDSAFALTVSGLIKAYFLQDLENANRCYEHAIALNPNEPLAWLYTATLRAWQGRGDEAANAAQKALNLAPIGGSQYYVESLCGLALVTAGKFDDAILLLLNSMRLNATHSSTYRALAMAYVLNGQLDEGRKVIKKLMSLEPTFTVSVFLSRYGGRSHPYSKVLAQALLEAGVPR